ncbi:PH domain-containing protein, partial [Nephila pilipes]
MFASLGKWMTFHADNLLQGNSTDLKNAETLAYGSWGTWKVGSYLMAARRVIAGYLVLKPAGALSRLKGRKRLWFVLDESKCRLLYYKSEVDARSKDPLGAIEIRGAAISLALEEDNQFVVHSNGREHALVAEDHESMMLWILALQARQDKSIPEPVAEASTSSKRKQPQPSSNNAQHNIHTVAASVKSKVLQRTHSLQLHPERRHDALRRMHSLWTTTSQDADPIPNGK